MKLVMMCIVIATVCVLFSSLGFTRVAQKTTGRITRYEVQQGDEEKFRQALGTYVMKALSKKSNVMAEAYYEQDKPSVLWLIERWTSKGAMNKAGPLTGSSLATIYNIKDLEPLTKQQWRRTAKNGEQQLIVMLFVDAKKGTQQTFKSIYHEAMPQFRSEPGVVTYQLSQVEDDDTKFVTYEKFRSPDAFNYHLHFPPVRPIIQFLETSIDNPPFQQGLHTLIEIAPLTRE